MESVEHMTRALQVASNAMRSARENDVPAEAMSLLEESRVRVLRVAKREADVDIESQAVNGLALVAQGRHEEAMSLLRASHTEWRQRGMTAAAALRLLEHARDSVVGGAELDPTTAGWTYDYFLTDLRQKVQAAAELSDEYEHLMSDLEQGVARLGSSR